MKYNIFITISLMLITLTCTGPADIEVTNSLGIDNVVISENLISHYPEYDTTLYGIDIKGMYYYIISPVPEELIPPESRKYVCAKKGWEIVCVTGSVPLICVPKYVCIEYKWVFQDPDCVTCQ